MQKPDEEFARRVTLLRNRTALSQAKTSELIGVAVRTYQRYEEWFVPSHSNLQKLCDYFKCEKAWLLTGMGEPFPGETKQPVVEISPVRIVQPRPGPEQKPRPDKTALLKKAEVVLDSETTYRKALAQNIEAFHAAVVDTQSLEGRVAALEKKLDRLSDAALEKDAQDADLEKGGTGI
jgi:transcriptional regulator with XRE-family HTH domain